MRVELDKLRVGAYARYSSDLQSDMSVEDQLRLLQRYVDKHGGRWENVTTYSDAAVSGSSMARSGLSALRKAVQDGSLDVVVMESVDRLSRDMADSAKLLKEFAFQDVRLLAVSDGIDTADPSSTLNYGIRAVMGEQYIRDLSAKTRRGLRGRAAHGFATGGLPFGYGSVRNVDDRGKSLGSEIVIDEGEATLVRRVFRMFADGRSYLGIATLLNDEGIPTPRSARKRNDRGWVDTTIRSMLRNAAYIGQWSFGVKRWVKEPETGARRPRNASEEDVQTFARPHLRIVDHQLWEQVQARIQNTSGKYGGRSAAAPVRRTSYPLSGLLFCGSCGAPMVIAGGSPVRYYRCGDAHKRGTCEVRDCIREPLITGKILDLVKSQLSNPESTAYLAEMLRRRASTTKSEASVELKAVQSELGKVDGRIDALVEAVASGAVKGRALAALSGKLEAEEESRAKLQSRFEAVQSASTATVKTPTADDLAERAEGLISSLEDSVAADPVRAREQIRRLVPGGRITMRFDGVGEWTASLRLYPAIVVGRGTRATNANRPRVASGAVYRSGCADRI